MLFAGTWRFTAKRVARANRKRDEDKARKVASRYVRWRPRDEHGWLLWSSVEENYWTDEADREKILRQGLKLNPESVRIASALAQCLIRQRKVAEAQRLLDRARRYDAASMWPYIALIELSWWEQEFDLARVHARQAEIRLDLDPDDLSNAWALVDQLIKLSEMDWATRLLRVMVDQKPMSPDPYILLSLLLVDSDEQASEKLLTQARRRWKGDKQTFSGQVDDLKEWLEACREPLATFRGASRRASPAS
jgi:tetratricopeptide (TPR) repeat protein